MPNWRSVMPTSDYIAGSTKSLICDDVRTEVSGKFTLVGVYPDDAIQVGKFPHTLVCNFWCQLIPKKLGQHHLNVRVIDVKNSRPLLSDLLTTNTVTLAGSVPWALSLRLADVPGPTKFEVQIQFPKEEWIPVGRFELRTSAT
jgi:hypothetical protein